MTAPAGEDGDWLDYTITYLEMTARPEWPHPPAPRQPGLALIRAEDPPARWFLHLYDSVGADHEWPTGAGARGRILKPSSPGRTRRSSR